MVKKIFLPSLILLIAFFLRLHNYTKYPQRGATSDEYTYSFLGVSLLTKHVPISWSYFGSYNHRQDLTIKGLYFPIVWPYFDHPPLNGLLVGLWSLVWGGNSFEKIQLSVIRIVPIMLSEISSLLVYLIAERKYGKRVGLWSLLIYVTVPIFVIQSKVVLAENLLTPLFLLTTYLYDRVQKHITMKHALLFGVLAGLSLWTKEVGVSVFGALFFIMIIDRVRFSVICDFVFISILFLLGYIAYGMYFDGNVFWKIITEQANRDIGPQTLTYILSTPIIINKVYYDGWYFLGFISLFASLLNIKKFKTIIIPAFVYFLLLLVLLTQGGEMGWYLIPLFPFMAIFISSLIVESIETKSWYIFAMLLFVGFSQIRYIYQENFGLTAPSFRILSILLFAPFIFSLMVKNGTLFRNLGHAYFYIFIIGNVYLTYTYIHPA